MWGDSSQPADGSYRVRAMVDPSDFVVLLARQRSGTHALRATLDAHPDVFCLNEVFHPDQAEWRTLSWFDFVERQDKPRIVAALRSEAAQAELFLEYLAALRESTDKRHIVLDVKYNSTHVLDGPWQGLTTPPALFGIVMGHRMRILHLTRRNHLRFFLSLKKAERGRWADPDPAGAEHAPWARMGHVRAPDDGDGDPQLHVSIDELLYYLELCRAEDEAVDFCVAGHDLMLTVEYEDLFPRLGAPPAEAEIQRIAAWLGIDPRFDANPPALRKLAVRPLPETIANYDEVAAALTGTSYEPMLADERMYRSAASSPG
jgi:hypothetical protein